MHRPTDELWSKTKNYISLTSLVGLYRLSCLYRKMRELSYRWLLPVRWRRWRSRCAIDRSRKSYAACTLHCSTCYRRGVIGDEIFNLRDADLCWHAGFRWENTGWLSTFFAPVTLTLTRWPLYINLNRIPWRYTTCANMNFLCEGFRKLWSDRQTDRQNRPIIRL